MRGWSRFGCFFGEFLIFITFWHIWEILEFFLLFGGKSFTKSYRCLASLGRLFVFGGSSFVPGAKRNLLHLARAFVAMPSYKPMGLMDKNRGVFGVNLGHLWHRTDALQEELRAIVDLVHDGTFAPVVDAVYPFDRAAEAHAYIKARKNFGKVLLTPG